MLRDDWPEWRRHARALRASQHAPRKLPETQKAGGGAGKTAPAAAPAKAVPPRGGPAPVFGNIRVPFMDDYEREEDLLQMPGCRDEVGLYMDPDFPAGQQRARAWAWAWARRYDANAIHARCSARSCDHNAPACGGRDAAARRRSCVTAPSHTAARHTHAQPNCSLRPPTRPLFRFLVALH